jgi:hypothetical protein
MSNKNRPKNVEALICELVDYLRPCAVPPTLLHEILPEAARRAGWQIVSGPGRRGRISGGKARQAQRNETLGYRRVFVAILFKKLPARFRAKPQSLGTAQAIIGRLQDLNIDVPMNIRTIQADVRFLSDNGNFGI